jgi:hypothetical protein
MAAADNRSQSSIAHGTKGEVREGCRDIIQPASADWTAVFHRRGGWRPLSTSSGFPCGE